MTIMSMFDPPSARERQLLEQLDDANRAADTLAGALAMLLFAIALWSFRHVLVSLTDGLGGGPGA